MIFNRLHYGVVALIITNIIWGAAPPIFKLALENIPPFTLGFIRFLGASILMLPLMVFYWKKISYKDFVTALVAGFFGIFVNIAFFFLGLERGVSINASIIGTAGPVFGFLLSVFWLREKPRLRVFAGMMAGLTGVVIMVISPFFGHSAGGPSGQIVANLFYILATVGIVVSPLIGKQTLSRVNPYQFTFITFVFSALLFLPLAAPEWRSWNPASLDARGYSGIFFGVVFSSFIAYLFFYWGTARIAAQEIGLFSYIDPVVTILVAIPLLGEVPTTSYIIGAALVFFGIFIAENRLSWHPVGLVRIKKIV